MKINELREEINLYLKNYFNNKKGYNEIIYESVSYSLNIGGKRIRPILMLLSYKLYKNDIDKIMPMACAIEMIHTYSLIHDDLPCMDNDDLRRGMPTNHIKFGENIAVLAGDTLLNEAMHLMIDTSLKNGNQFLEASKEIAYSSGAEGMIGGQVVDILSEGVKISEDKLYYMHSKKTGELIKASVLGGAILANAPKKDLDILKEFGETLGLAFQIKDDILDVTSTTQKLGKKVKSDEENAKTNFISLYGLDYCNNKCENLTNKCIDLLNELTVDTSIIKTLTLSLLVREN